MDPAKGTTGSGSSTPFEPQPVLHTVNFGDVPLESTITTEDLVVAPPAVGSDRSGAARGEDGGLATADALFGSFVSSPSFSGVRRRRPRTSSQIHKAEQAARAQFAVELRAELGHHSSDDDDAKVEEELKSHKAVLQRASSRMQLNDAIRSREQTELHKTVAVLTHEVEHLRGQLKEETAARAAATNALHTSRVERAQLEERIDAQDAAAARQRMHVEELEARNEELELLLSSQSQMTFDVTALRAPAARRTGRKASSLKKVKSSSAGVGDEAASAAAPPACLGVVEWAEERAREALEAASQVLFAHVAFFMPSCGAGYRALRGELQLLLALEGTRRNQLALEECHSSSHLQASHLMVRELMDIEAACGALHAAREPSVRAELLRASMNRHRQLLDEMHDGRPRQSALESRLASAVHRTTTGAVSLTHGRRSRSLPGDDQSGRPWYPAGSRESTRYHCKSPLRARTPSRSTTPAAPRGASPGPSARASSPGVSRTSSHTTPPAQRRATSPSPSPSQHSPPQPTPRSKQAASPAPPQQQQQWMEVGAYATHAAPPHLSRTVENMAALLTELQQWKASC